MHILFIVLLALVIFILLAYFRSAKRNTLVDKAKDNLANAKAAKQAAKLDKETADLLDSITEVIVKQNKE